MHGTTMYAFFFVGGRCFVVMLISTTVVVVVVRIGWIQFFIFIPFKVYTGHLHHNNVFEDILLLFVGVVGWNTQPWPCG